MKPTPVPQPQPAARKDVPNPQPQVGLTIDDRTPTPRLQGLAQLLNSPEVAPKPQPQMVGKTTQLQSVVVPNRPPQPAALLVVQLEATTDAVELPCVTVTVDEVPVVQDRVRVIVNGEVPTAAIESELPLPVTVQAGLQLAETVAPPLTDTATALPVPDPVAVAFARQGTPVIGFDIDAARIEELKTGHDRTREVDPKDLRQRVNSKPCWHAALPTRVEESQLKHRPFAHVTAEKRPKN